jgi:hypothetical protein
MTGPLRCPQHFQAMRMFPLDEATSSSRTHLVKPSLADTCLRLVPTIEGYAASAATGVLRGHDACRSGTRRRSCAFVATMIVEALPRPWWPRLMSLIRRPSTTRRNNRQSPVRPSMGRSAALAVRSLMASARHPVALSIVTLEGSRDGTSLVGGRLTRPAAVGRRRGSILRRGRPQWVG